VTSAPRARHRYFEGSVESYCLQTYSPRELIIVCDGEADDVELVKAVVARAGGPDIRPTFIKGKQTLGALRNVSLQLASGGIVCQWDDDDLYHPSRLEVQARPLLEAGKVASYLVSYLHYFEDCRELFLMDWSESPLGCLPGTVMIQRGSMRAYPRAGAFSSRNEDSLLLFYLRRTPERVEYINGAPHLYVYRFHGQNTWPRSHHSDLVSRYAVSRELVDAAWPSLAPELARLPFESGPADVMGRDGRVASWHLGRLAGPGPAAAPTPGR
jgi:glycosyltransferase involved in cell wall biosynthesis